MTFERESIIVSAILPEAERNEHVKSDKTTKTGWRRLLVSAFAAATLSAIFADTHTVASGATETVSGVTETSAFVKSGVGTLILSGNNSMTRMQVAAGTLKVKDFSALDTGKAYKTASNTGVNRLFSCDAGGYSGTFALPADWPAIWEAKYTSTGAYLSYLKGMKVVIN